MKPKLQVKLFFNCQKCFDQLPVGQSMHEYSRTQAGFTDEGIQVWCNRHNCEVVHLKYEEGDNET